MDKKLINKLQNAGVDAQVILSLILDDEADQTPGAVTEDAAPVQTPAPVLESPDGAGTLKDEKPQTGATNDAILAAINKLTGSIQAMNIRNLGWDPGQLESADDVLSKFIN